MATTKNISIRMYNVGFGDSFLLLIPGEKRTKRVLVDCGMHSIGPGPRKMKEVVSQIVADTTDDDGKSRIDVVVCTHRHQDHVSGFSQKLWDQVMVGEVWMPWTEHPTDPEARRIRELQSSRAHSLALAMNRLAAAKTGGVDGSVIAMTQNSLTNRAAMTTLHAGFAGNPTRRFLPGKSRSSQSFEPEALCGVKVHVLGPSRNPEVIRDMNPETGESYLQFLMTRAAPSGQRLRPFRSEWGMKVTAYRELYQHLEFNEEHQKEFKEIGSGTEFDLVTKLDKAVNGTSLLLMFVIGKAHLLFPGDAQWGTWKAALEDPEWSKLLSKTAFYKVGHHGSHNATPRSFVEKHLRKKFSAMVSTKNLEKWPDIPRLPLLKQLRQRSNSVIRSDRRDARDPAGAIRTSSYVEIQIPI
ncbi:MAG TPA: MBL fold metallo-hydrolase [Pyrinomonadaceae bacterium]|nr:MBL fold metallo-hydrolase [Pyrinomonadaceae bacterium]